MVVNRETAISGKSISAEEVNPDNRGTVSEVETAKGGIKLPLPEPKHPPEAPARDIVIEGAATAYPDNHRTTSVPTTGAQIRAVRREVHRKKPVGAAAARVLATTKAIRHETSETNLGSVARNRMDPSKADRSIETQGGSDSNSNSGRTGRRRRPTSNR